MVAMSLVKSMPITLYVSTEEIITMTNQEDVGIKSEKALVIKVHTQDAYFMETFQRNNTEQTKSSSLFMPQAVAFRVLRVKKSRSHQKEIFEILKESKQTSREVRTIRS